MHRPAIAALLSLLVPGLGQLYNQSRKGLLFFAVGLMNLVLLAAVLFTEPIVDGLRLIAEATHSRVNDSIITILNQLHLSIPACLAIAGAALAFVCFAVRDAYDGANLRRSSSVDSSTAIGLTEAVGASYIVHVACVLMLCVFFSFFLIPPKRVEETSVCEFVLQSANEPAKEKTNIVSLKSAAAHGRFDPTKAINNTHAAVPSADSSAEQQQDAVHQQAVQQQQAVRQQQAVQPQEAVQAQKAVKRAEKVRAEKVEPPKPVRKQPSLMKQAVQPKPVQRREAMQPKQAVQPRRSVEQRQAVPPRQTVARKSRTASRRSSDISGQAFNLDRDIDREDGSVSANADLNFGPYMNQLQRRMKRNWLPPAGATTRAVTVLFSIHPDGRITSIRVARSSGSAACDRAALAAVEATSPFMPLPDGATGPVNIEFTFDYSTSPSPRTTH